MPGLMLVGVLARGPPWAHFPGGRQAMVRGHCGTPIPAGVGHSAGLQDRQRRGRGHASCAGPGAAQAVALP